MFFDMFSRFRVFQSRVSQCHRHAPASGVHGAAAPHPHSAEANWAKWHAAVQRCAAANLGQSHSSTDRNKKKKRMVNNKELKKTQGRVVSLSHLAGSRPVLAPSHTPRSHYYESYRRNTAGIGHGQPSFFSIVTMCKASVWLVHGVASTPGSCTHLFPCRTGRTHTSSSVVVALPQAVKR